MYSIKGIEGNNLIIEFQNSLDKFVNIVDKYRDYRAVSDKHYLDTSNGDIVLININTRLVVKENDVIYKRATQYDFDKWQYEKKIGSNGLEGQSDLCDNALVYKYLMFN